MNNLNLEKELNITIESDSKQNGKEEDCQIP